MPETVPETVAETVAETVIVNVNAIECPICFVDTTSEQLTVLPCCNYILCKNCWNAWRERSTRCPNCRTIATRYKDLDCKTVICMISPCMLTIIGWIIYNHVK